MHAMMQCIIAWHAMIACMLQKQRPTSACSGCNTANKTVKWTAATCPVSQAPLLFEMMSSRDP